MIGVILAGGLGRRLGGVSKAAVEIGGRPLAAYSAAALAGACDRVVIVAKADSEIPRLVGVDRWDEPDEPRHPLTGIVFALEEAGEPILVCAADMPYVTADACSTLIASGGRTSVVVGVAGGVVQPLFAMYAPAALDALRAGLPGSRLTDVVESLAPARVGVPPAIVRSINTPEDLEQARAELG